MHSPESSSVSDTFVRTLKRNDARVHPRPDANAVLARLGAWFTDNYEHHSHRGFVTRSLREFIRGRTRPTPRPIWPGASKGTVADRSVAKHADQLPIYW